MYSILCEIKFKIFGLRYGINVQNLGFLVIYLTCDHLFLSSQRLGVNNFVKKLIGLNISLSHIKYPIFLKKLNIRYKSLQYSTILKDKKVSKLESYISPSNRNSAPVHRWNILAVHMHYNVDVFLYILYVACQRYFHFGNHELKFPDPCVLIIKVLKS